MLFFKMKLFNWVYLCDRCNNIELTLKEYLFNREKGKKYCKECYEMLYLVKGTCNKCGNYYTIRNHNQKITKICSCSHEVYLVCKV